MKAIDVWPAVPVYDAGLCGVNSSLQHLMPTSGIDGRIDWGRITSSTSTEFQSNSAESRRLKGIMLMRPHALVPRLGRSVRPESVEAELNEIMPEAVDRVFHGKRDRAAGQQ